MQIYVCVKHVPDTAATIKIEGDAGFAAAGVKFIINPYDEYAIEEAVRISEKAGDGEVIIVCVGPAAATSTLRSALAMGAHRAVHVQSEAQFLNSTATAQALKAAITEDGAPDLILTGKGAVDTEGFQTPYRLAAALGFPVANEVSNLSIEGDTIIAEQEIGGGARMTLEMAKPCVIGATKGLNEPRYPKFPDIMKAKKKPIKEIDITAMEIPALSKGSDLLKLKAVPERTGAKVLEGDLSDQVTELVQILKNDEKVL